MPEPSPPCGEYRPPIWRRWAIGLAYIGLLIPVAYWLLQQRSRSWSHDGHSVPLPSVAGELFFLSVPQLVRAGPDRLAVVRLGPTVRFVPHVFTHEGLSTPASIEAWAKLLDAPVVFNAGQFDEHLHHLGWLKSRRGWLEPGRKAAFKGLLVSEPIAAARPELYGEQALNAIVDLERTDAGVAAAYSNVVQSMMLVDEGSQVRVRQSQLAACRTVVAEDRQGQLMVIVSEGAITLHDLAAWLPRGLNIVRAINLDGGAESQLVVTTATEQWAFIGRYGHDNLATLRPSMAPASLPAVIAVYPGS